MKMYLTESCHYRLVIRAKTGRAATAWAARRYGTVVGPFQSRAATQAELREHLKAGAVFWDAVTRAPMEREEAYALADA